MLLIGVWLLAGTGVVVLLIAAVHSRSDQVCKGLEIIIDVPEDAQKFLDKNDIINVITKKRTVRFKGQPIKSINLNEVEAKLEREMWIRDAELFFDNTGMLKVKVSERIPVARVFASTGESFYIDSNCKKLPLTGKASAKLPVFTGYPFAMKKTAQGERKLLNEMKDLSIYLASDPFWMAQVAQVDISASREFEIIPTIGNHVIEFGNATQAEEKFHRLMIFYKQVLAKTGMEKYERIKVQFDKQVIGVKSTDNN